MNQKSAGAAELSKAPDRKYTVPNSLVSYYLLLMFGFFPLFLTDQYAHARTDKFWLYLVLTTVLTVSVGACAVAARHEAKSLRQDYGIIGKITVPDIMMLCFWGFALISTVLSDHFTDALTGFSARDNGLILLTAYMLMYFVLTRYYYYKSYVIAVYLIISGVVALLTVLNFFYIDPLGMLSGYDDATIADFGSTIGNKNIIAAFMCMFLPAAVMSFVVTGEKILRVIAGFAIALAYTGMLCADSSSDILGLAVILPVMAVFCARSHVYLRRYVLALMILFASGKLLELFSAVIGGRNKGFELIPQFLIFSPIMYAPIVFFGLLYLVLRFAVKDGDRFPARAIRITLGSLFSVCALTALGTLVYFSVFDKTTDLGDFEKLLRFSDSWGTHRGFMWRVSMEEYGKFGILGILFGSGPDTAYFVLQPHFGELMERFGDASTDCAHNEFINYLLTQGALGLLAYLGLMGSVIVRGIKTAKKNPLVPVFVSAVICYLAQSAVNLYNPIVTPLLFIFASLSEALNREKA